ncbi:AAA family ATPase [Nocardioides lacusdianchii]|uniref:AAA family ATPase n=1 Tax=Nocardioides lacusdianchii TaxID=2783664 RepID=UPI001CC952CA|nr:AAA family ATPase [Nocardioides lacusdianchii]
MDWNRLDQSARKIMLALGRFGGPTDTMSVLNLANQGEPDWLQSPEVARPFFQALELVELLNLVHRPDGLSLAISEKGRAELALGPDRPTLLDSQDPVVGRWLELEELKEAVQSRFISGENRFTHLRLSRWRQFADLEIDFHPRLTVLTGANASGKTTLLNLLAPHFSWGAQLLSKRDTGAQDGPVVTTVGQLSYSNGVRTPIAQQLAPGVSVTAPIFPAQQLVPGLFISSHRSISAYQQLVNLPARFSASTILLQQFSSEVYTRYMGGSTQHPPLYRMKEALVAAAMHGYGNQAVQPDEEARAVWEGFQAVLLDFLPRDLLFEELRVFQGDVIIHAGGTSFPLEAASGGLSAMLELSWQVFLRGRESGAFTVCIDEPENHLHPELQRSIIPALLHGFPDATFIVATHSPFVVTGTRDCAVYALRHREEEGRVSARRIDSLDASSTPNDTLTSVLGLDTPLPLWAEQTLSAALLGLPPRPSAEQLRTLKNQLTDLGLAQYFPASIEALTAQEYDR